MLPSCWHSMTPHTDPQLHLIKNKYDVIIIKHEIIEVKIKEINNIHKPLPVDKELHQRETP